MASEEKRRRVWKIVLALVVLWVVVVPIIAMAAFALLHYRYERAMPSTKAVPNLIGLDVKSAEAKARDAGFSMEVMGTRWDLPGPLGTIVQQMPDAGESVYLRRVAVVTSVEDPEKTFQEQQRKQLSDKQKKQ
jgi:beta-lactam-binding protein with PASTA domain